MRITTSAWLRLAPLLLTPLLFGVRTVDADRATFVGRDNSVAADEGEIPDYTDGAWRTDTAVKPYDVDGDNIYGTDGYALFSWNNPGWTDDLSSGADPIDGTGGDPDAQNLLDLPSYIDSVQVPPFGWGGGADLGNRGFMDDPEFEGFLHNATLGATTRDIDLSPRDCEEAGCTGEFDTVATYGAGGGAANVAARTVIHRATTDPFRLTAWLATNDASQTQTWDVTVAPMADPDEPLWGGDSPAIPGVDHPDSNISIDLDPHTDPSVPPDQAPHSYYIFDIPGGSDPVTLIAYNDSNDNPGISGFMFDDPFKLLDNGTLADAQARANYSHDTLGTWVGDSNNDGEFNTSDLVFVLTRGEYEDGVVGNSTYSDGDWNGDKEFSSGDLIAAFSDGGYEQGGFVAAAVVPEPSSWVLLVLGLLAIRRRKA